MKENTKKAISVIATFGALLLVISTIAVIGAVEKERTKDFKTSEEWAILVATRDFLEIRDVSEVAYYTTEKLNFMRIESADCDRVDLYKIVMTDIRYNKEKYLVVVKYNLDKHILGSKDRFGEEHLVDLDFEEI